MKAFDLETYNRLVSEGKTPKIMTRDGRSARILCTNRLGIHPVIALYSIGDGNDAIEEVGLHYADGSYDRDRPFPDDLFFADLEPTYRPYKDAEEFLEAQKEHGSYLLACGQKHLPSLVDDRCIVTVSTSGAKAWTYSEVLNVFVWRDYSPCGVKEE